MTEKPPSGTSAPVRLRPRRPCPICEKPSQQAYHPFCSARCADIDLHRWLGGNYRVASAETPDFSDPQAASGGGGTGDENENDV